ncbi:hypothetical protein Anapl_08041 [Anas platyrhynchos]|uniref:Uncharacterized protein n=1 Tax=Anas platyrhynchos TaxID=8839 RepID=R0KG78_ANAPL|nr:hypothetical protein Anapl_08041 [Anas platyrhynchos]
MEIPSMAHLQKNTPTCFKGKCSTSFPTDRPKRAAPQGSKACSELRATRVPAAHLCFSLLFWFEVFVSSTFSKKEPTQTSLLTAFTCEP